MYVTDTPVIDRLTDPVLSALSHVESMAGELDMALYDPDFSTYTAREAADSIAEGVQLALDAYHTA